MSDSCKAFRDEWLRLDGVDEAHSRTCADCAAWLHAARRQVASLRGLEQLVAPGELEERVAAELAGDGSRRLIRVLSSQARLAAPPALDERVELDLREGAIPGAERSGRARVASALDLHPAPHVLERLLDEELRAPERQRVERFSGSLARLHAPDALEGRLRLAVRRRALLRLAIGPLATFAAAGLVVWLATWVGRDEPRERRFQVVQASSLEELDPMARALAESLGGTGGLR